MKAYGNGTPEQCAANLLRIARGEVPYERIKGLDAGLIDKPFTLANPELRADIEWVISTYEPRIDLEQTSIEALLPAEGQFAVNTVTKGGHG